METRYCPTCDAPRGPDQQEAGHCLVCGTALVDEAGAEPTPEREAPAAPPPRPPASVRPFPSLAERSPGSRAGPPPLRDEPEAAARPPEARPPLAEEAAREGEEVDYRRLVADVEAQVAAGYEVFGLVGHPSSGKTHFLKALTYLLDRHAMGGQRATVEFHRADVPGQTGASVFDYAYTGPSDERWVFLDAGGELYVRLRENDWSAPGGVSVRLTEWLRHCRGLFCFLHLQPGHFGVQPLDVDPTVRGDEGLRERLAEEQRKAREARQELEFFKYFLLFLRALRAEGAAEPVVARCRQAGNLEEALRGYHDRAPRLDVPVMFFFTQADAYRRDGFEIRSGLHLHPRRLPMPAAPFTARYLPSLFGAVASQARHFKFDFLQSYEDHPTERRDEKGRPVFETYFHAPDDPGLLLSAGLGAGVEFVLRNRPGAGNGRRWLPELDTRRALLLHRLLHPRAWQGVPRNLLGGWMPATEAPPREAREAAAP